MRTPDKRVKEGEIFSLKSSSETIDPARGIQ